MMPITNYTNEKQRTKRHEGIQKYHYHINYLLRLPPIGTPSLSLVRAQYKL